MEGQLRNKRKGGWSEKPSPGTRQGSGSMLGGSIQPALLESYLDTNSRHSLSSLPFSAFSLAGHMNSYISMLAVLLFVQSTKERDHPSSHRSPGNGKEERPGRVRHVTLHRAAPPAPAAVPYQIVSQSLVGRASRVTHLDKVPAAVSSSRGPKLE